MNPVIYYCYDAYCGWCYGFSSVMKLIAEEFKGRMHFEVLSGGMIPAESPRHISATASFIRESYRRVEELTGIRFGEDYLWHINNPELSDWHPHSEKAAIALCILKEFLPNEQVRMAADLQHALHFEGRDLTDDEAYRHLLQEYGIPADEFFKKMSSDEYRDKAHYEFALCRQLQVTAFPAVLLQVEDHRFYLVARGYTTYENVKARLEKILAEAGLAR